PCALRSNQKQNHPKPLKTARCASYPRALRRYQKQTQKDRKTWRVAPHSWVRRAKDINFRNCREIANLQGIS
ncbi:hypothetical protein A2U01_0088440, partial [Trifolium medium]|nr:hypothetical protein [Trifolium medium]